MSARSTMTIALALGILAASVGEGLACPRGMRRDLERPELTDAGLAPPSFADGSWQDGALWLRIAPAATRSAATRYLIERVAGDQPLALSSIWRQAVPADADGTVRVATRSGVAVPPFGLAVRVRAVDERGVSGPSNLIWIASPHGAPPPRGDRAGKILFAGLFGLLGLLAVGFRASRTADSRVRLAAVAALVGAIVLLATSGMPWLATAEPAAECRLGDESVCAPPPLATLDQPGAELALFELERWRASGAAIQLGQLLAFALLLPALIWLLVEPRARPAQATAVVGASVAAFGFLAVAFYRTTMPSWLAAEPYSAFDLALLGSGAVVLAAIAIVRQAVAAGERAVPPRAVALPRA